MNSDVGNFIDWDVYEEVREDYDPENTPIVIAYSTIAVMLETLAGDGWENGGDGGIWLRKKAIEWRELRAATVKATKARIARQANDAETEANRPPRCEGVRKDGGSCKMARLGGTPYCRHHQDSGVVMEAS